MDQNLGENKHEFYFKRENEVDPNGFAAPKSLLEHQKAMQNPNNVLNPDLDYEDRGMKIQ